LKLLEISSLKRVVILIFVILALALAGFCQRSQRRGSSTLPAGSSEAEKRILAVFKQAQEAGELFQNVPISDGKMLRILAETTNAKNVVEIGTSTGLSGLWFCMALQKTGGKLTTHEFDGGRAATARRHFKDAGVDNIVTIVEGDAHQTVQRLKDPIDVLFIDADKEGYTDYLKKLLPLVRPGGLILAHNVDMVREYLSVVEANPALETTYYMEGGGLSITLKKR
jgi:predicted O-methyltransferase YrrM